MKNKNAIILALICLVYSYQAQAQFGLGKAIKDKVEKKKEPEQKQTNPVPVTKAEEPKKELTPEEKEAALRNTKFFAKGMEDAALEQECIKAIARTPEFFDLENMSQLVLLHITSFDWVVMRDNYGTIESKQIMVCVGIKKDGKCYRKEFYFKKKYMGGGQYSETLQGYIPMKLDYKKEMSCVVLDSLIQVQAAKSRPVSTTKISSTPNSTNGNTSNASKNTNTTKPTTTTTSTSTATTKPSVLSTIPTQVISLAAIGINAIMTVPKGTTVRQVGEFKIIGNDKVEIHAELTTLTLAEMKSDVKTNDMYNGTGKIVSSNPNGFIFTCIEDEEEGKWAHIEFFKTIGGKKYRFIDNRLTEKPYTVEELQPFLEALNTLP